MKNLWLIRHATAENGGSLLDDFNRKLENIGRIEAANAGKFILKCGIIPGSIFSSSAFRTMETSEIIQKQLGNGVLITPIKDLYNCGFQTILNKIKGAENDISQLALVGHNPGISQVASMLSEKDTFQMAPGSAICLAFQVKDWASVLPGMGKTIHFYPN